MAYQVNSILQDETGLIEGMLRVLPVGNRTTTDFYINLSKKVKFCVAESDGKLTVLFGTDSNARTASVLCCRRIF